MFRSLPDVFREGGDAAGAKLFDGELLPEAGGRQSRDSSPASCCLLLQGWKLTRAAAHT